MASSQKRIAKELSELTTSPPAGISVHLIDEADLYTWKATIEGPEGSPYAGGTFSLLLTLPSTYPFKPPTLSFLTKIYHPNVSNDVPATPSTTTTTSTLPAPNPSTTSRRTSSTSTPARNTITTHGGATLTPAPTPSNATTPSTSSSTTTGLMCLGPLRPDAWKPSTKISAILEFARQLLREPNADDAVETRIADEYRNDRRGFEREARDWTKRYAMPGKK